jgi:hypothetical protein
MENLRLHGFQAQEFSQTVGNFSQLCNNKVGGKRIKTLNQLLVDQFGNHRRPIDQDQTPNWVKTVESKLRFAPKFDLTYDLSEEDLGAILKSDKKIRDLHSTENEIHIAGTDVLAFYKPFAYSTAMDFLGWGIHFNLEAILQLAAELMTDFKRINSKLTYGEAVQFVFEVVERHEVEHAVAEIVGAHSQSFINLKVPHYISLKDDQSFHRISEIVATQQEMLKGALHSKINKSKAVPALLVWSSLQLPKYYREWNTVSTSQSEKDLLNLLGIVNGRLELEQVRNTVGHRGNSKQITIPKYFWIGSAFAGSIPTPFLRTVFDCKKMAKFLKKNDDKAPLGTRVKIVPSPDHDFQVLSDNLSRPIKFACHAWREVPEMVISQLSDAFGANSKQEFKKFLVKEL